MTENEEISEAERELLLEQYKELRESIRMQVQQNSRRVLSGIAAVGAVAGASLLRESEWLLAFIPFIFAIVLIRIINKSIYIGSFASHAIEIEEKLQEIESLFYMEKKYGYFGEEVQILESRHRWISLRNLIEYGTVLIISPLFIFTCIIGLTFWDSRPDELMFVNKTILCIIYLMLILYTAIIAFGGWLYFRNLKGDTDTDE